MIIPSSIPSKSAAFPDPLPDPTTLLTGLIVKAVPLQIVAVCAGMAGNGFTVIVALNAAPIQLSAEVGVTTKVTSIGRSVVLINVPEIAEELVPAARPEIPVIAEGAFHEYVVPTGTISVPFEGATVNVEPEHAKAVLAAMIGFGFTVTVMLNGVPTHV